jgi:DNA-binding phage protein
MLTLVHPAPAGNGTDRSKRRRGYPAPALSLNPEETKHFRAALRNIARGLGSVAALAKVVGVPCGSLYQALGRSTPPSVALAFRIAKVARVPLEALLAGGIAAAGTCPTCGAKRAGGAS